MVQTLPSPYSYLFPKTELDWKSASNQNAKSASNYIYSLKNTHMSIEKKTSNQKTLVFKDANIRGGFAQVPNIILRDPGLSGNEKTLYALLLSYAWQNDECFPGQDTLAESMSLTVRSITTLLNQLKRKRLIGWKRQGLGRVNIYHIRRLSDAYPQMVD